MMSDAHNSLSTATTEGWPSDDQIWESIRLTFHESTARKLSFQRWKDGIEIDTPTHEAVLFAKQMFAMGVASVAQGSPQRGDNDYIISQHIGWLKQFVEGMTEANWQDMRLRAERQLSEISRDLDAAPQPTQGGDKGEAVRAALQMFVDWGLGRFDGTLPEQHDKAMKAGMAALAAPQPVSIAYPPMDREHVAKIFAYIWHGDIGEWRGFLSKADAFLAYPSAAEIRAMAVSSTNSGDVA